MTQSLARAVSKKRILLVVGDDVRRDLRARVLRKLGTDVECAADMSEARSLWRADTFNLVLLDVIGDARNVEEFCADVKNATPPQAIAFLVGKPAYIAASPRADEMVASENGNGHAAWGEVVASLFAGACENLPRRWGFQEAAWRIAAARSMKDPCRNQPRSCAKLSVRVHEKSTIPSWAEAIAQHSITILTSATAGATVAASLSNENVPAAPDLPLEKIG